MKDKHRNGIRTGKRDVTPDKPAHTRGVRQGNSPGNYDSQQGHLPDGTSTARRSTGINPGQHDPVMPGMPNLSPA